MSLYTLLKYGGAKVVINQEDAAGNLVELGNTPTLIDPDENHVCIDTVIPTLTADTGISSAYGPWVGHSSVISLIVSGITTDTLGLYGGYTSDSSTFTEIPRLNIDAAPAVGDPYGVADVGKSVIFGVITGTSASPFALAPPPPYLAVHRTGSADTLIATITLVAGR